VETIARKPSHFTSWAYSPVGGVLAGRESIGAGRERAAGSGVAVLTIGSDGITSRLRGGAPFASRPKAGQLRMI
jgi:hypothetical protein